MNGKYLLAGVLALGVAGAGNAAQAPGRDTPDFVFTVPLELKNIPGEVHTVVVWCEALNAVYNNTGGAARDQPGTMGTDPRFLQYRNGPQIIASTGAIMIPVQGHQGAAARMAGAPGAKPLPAWSVDRIEATSRGVAKPLQITPNSKLSAGELANLQFMQYLIIPKSGTSPSSTNAAVALYANTTGATDPALGTAFACHLGFRATALVDGKPTDFDVFAGQGSYESMPDENGKPSGAGDSKGGPGGANAAKVLTVYGNFPGKDGRPAGK